jgi:tRNA 2-thiocytidine biosynthesis protein TtcA
MESDIGQKETKRFMGMHRLFEDAIIDYDMIRPGDHVVAALSGGKDSLMLLRLLARKKIHVTNDFKLSAVFVNNGFPDDDKRIIFLQKFAKELDVPIHVIDTDMMKYFENGKKSKCYICSRVRRLAIFKVCDEINANVVAMGHHRNDFIETLFLNILFSGSIQAMKPKNPFFKGKYSIIRPMVYIKEKAVIAESENLGTVPFSRNCPVEGDVTRKYVRELLKKIYSDHPDAEKSVFRSLFSADIDYLLKKPSKKI